MGIWAALGHFCHGLVFFTLGLTAAFLHTRSRRIAIARRLSWLSFFALCESLVGWHNQLTALVPTGTLIPRELLPIIPAVGYTTLMAFGIQTFFPLNSSEKRRRLRVLHVMWAVPYAIALVIAYPETEVVVDPAIALIRYLLGFPGGILTAVGLRRQSYQSLEPALRARIRPDLRLIEASMATFGILNVFLVPEVAFFPADRLNVQRFAFLSNGWLIFAAGAGITFGLTRALTIVQGEIERWVEGVERLQALAEDRERIGRELHDGIIQSIYAAGLMLESLRPIIPKDPDRAQAQLGRVIENLNSIIRDIRRYIFDLRSDFTDEDVPAGINRLLRDFRVNTLLETELEVNGDVRTINSVERRRHVFQIVREALTNTARHARARRVSIHLDYLDDGLSLTVSDDGVGMEKLLVSKGYGLRNIRERARLLDGTLRIESAPGAGFTLHLTAPYDG
jgi:signal transduction histidine kinase